MIPVNIDYTAGRMTMRRTDIGRYARWKTDTHVTPEMWTAYEKHLAIDITWQDIIGELDNIAHTPKG